MILKDYLSIAGEPGLFKFIAQGKNSIIVENLETGKRGSAFSSARVSSLDDISIFTEGEDLPLGKVLDSIFEKESGGPAPDPKSDPEKLRKYFEEIVPDYSKEKVYASDIKKVFVWYNILQKKNLLVKEEPEKTETPGSVEPETGEATEAENIQEGEKDQVEEKKKKKSASRSKE
ncbi:MAG: DUF5606 domain-containing protein [Bacteroidales bacterium]